MTSLIQKLTNALFGSRKKKPEYSAKDKESTLADLKIISNLTVELALPANVFDLSKKSPSLRLEESRIGGRPAWPKDMAWPLAADGTNLRFLAQINFAEMPALEGFPNKGLLQFFINDDDLYGQAFEPGEPLDHKVIFHPELDGLGDAPSSLDSYEWGMTPLENDAWGDNGYVIEFTPKTLPVSLNDFRIDPLVSKLDFDTIEPELEAMFDSTLAAHNPGHGNIAGHPRFTQFDPRGQNSSVYAGYEDSICLLSLGYIPEILMFGDVGEACFLIKPEDLAKRDFSNLLYYWDCG